MARQSKRSDGLYEAKVSVGRDENGKLIRVSVYAKTQRELEAKKEELKQQYKQNLNIKDSNTLMKDYAKMWLQTSKAKKSHNTIAMYENAIEKHIVPCIGHFRLADIRKSDIQNLINEIYEMPETCVKVSMTLKQILSAALDDRLITENPYRNIELPKRPPSKKRALTDLEKQAILTAKLEPMQKCYLNILFYCGLRREEALGLMKSNFDFKTGTVSVSRAITFVKNDPVISVTKTELSDRTIPIPSEGFKEIKAYVDSLSSIYLFTKKDGNLITHSSYVKFWNGIVKELNRAVMTDLQWQAVESMPKNIRAKNRPITGLTAHIFRHNYATMLYYSGITIKKAAALLGHSNTKMIMEVYSHLDEEKEKAVEKLNENIKLAP